MGLCGQVDGDDGDQRRVSGNARSGAVVGRGMKTMLLFVAPLALIACSEAPVSNDAGADVDLVAPANETVAPEGTPTEAIPPLGEDPAVDAAEPAIGETQGGDGSEIALVPLQPDDAADLPGELACGFRLADARQSLMIARADVGDEARGVAVIRNGGYAERLMARTAGGFGAMERGISFGGRGMTVTIDRGERVSGGESPAYAATLLAQRADGAERRYQGLWTCGP